MEQITSDISYPIIPYEDFKRYKDTKFPFEKQILCRYVLRGTCPLVSHVCKYAHSISDLKYVFYNHDSNQYEQKLQQNENQLNSEVIDLVQPDYLQNIFYLHQYSMLKQKKIKEIVGLQSLSTQKQYKQYRKQIKKEIYDQLVRDFVQLLFEEQKKLKTEKEKVQLDFPFLIKELHAIGYKGLAYSLTYQNIQSILKDTAYNKVLITEDNKKINIFCPIEQHQDLIECVVKNIKESILEIVKLQQKNQQEYGYPVYIQQVQQYYFELAQKKLDIPDLREFLKSQNQSLTEFLLKQIKFTQEEQDYLNESISQEFRNNFPSNSIQQYIIINDSKQIDILFNFHIKNRLKTQIIDKFNSQILIKSQVFETYLYEQECEFLKKQFQLSDYIKYLRKTLTKNKIALYVKHLYQSWYLNLTFDVDSNTNLDKNQKQIQKQKQVAQTQQSLVIVNDLETLWKAMHILNKCESIGVDIEGNIELIQIGTGNSIIIFDFYTLETDPKLNECFVKTKQFLREIFQNNEIEKIFHSAIQDSQMIYNHFDKCTISNLFDTSAVHILIKILDKYRNIIIDCDHNNSNNNNQINEQIYTQLSQQINMPGLNSVLKAYSASNGENTLKDIVGHKFNLPEKEYNDYFLSRPINKEFLSYCIQDVEDLVEVSLTMQNTLTDLFQYLFSDNLKLNVIETLIMKIVQEISQTYLVKGIQV